jgi:stage II sporulation protein AA (anti-sigma F factor antagonist)
MSKPSITPSVWSLVIQQTSRDGALIVSPAGRLGSFGSGELIDALVAAMAQGHRKIVLDLSRVDYLSSAGLLALEVVLGRMHQEKGALVLCGVSEPVRLALDLAGLLPHIAVHGTVEDAVARVWADVDPADLSR